MFGKKSTSIDIGGNEPQNSSFLQKKVDALQKKLQASEKLQSSVFDFMSQFEDKVKDIVAEKLKGYSKKTEVKEHIEKASQESNMVLDEEAIDSKIERLDTSMTSKMNKVLNKFNKDVEYNKTQLEEITGIVQNLSHSKKGNAKELPHSNAELKSFKITVNKQVKDLADEIHNFTSNLASQEYVSILETEFREKINQMREQVNSFEADTLRTTSNVAKSHAPVELKKLQESVKRILDEHRRQLQHIKEKADIVIQREIEHRVANSMRNYEKHLKGLGEEFEAYIQKSVSIDQLGLLKKYLRDLNTRVDLLSRNLDKIIANVTAHEKIHDSLAVSKELNDMRKALRLINEEVVEVKDQVLNDKVTLTSEVEGKIRKLKSDFKSFEDYAVDQIDKTNKWVTFINERLK